MAIGGRSLGAAVLATKLDTSGLRSGFQQARSEAQRGVADIGRDLQRTGTILTATLTAPIVGFGAAVLSAAGGFESSMNRVRVLSQATGSDFERLQEQARELGATTIYSASQAADGMSFLAMAGLEVDEIYGAMPATLNLAAAAQLDLATAADIVTNVMTGYRIEVDGLENSVDVLTTAFISANTDLNQLGQAMSYAGPVASGLGVSFEEATAAIGMLSNAGIQGGRAGTSLSRILSILSTDGEKLGIAIYDAAGRMRPFADILEDIERQGLSSAEIMDFFGQRGGPGMLALLSQGSGALRDFADDLSDVGGTAEEVAKTQMEGLRGAVVELKSAFEGLLISFGIEGGLLGVAQGGVEILTNVVRWIDGWSNTSKQLAIAIGGILAVSGPFLVFLGTLGRAVPLVTTGVQLLRGAFLPFLGPAGLLVGMATGVLALINRLDEVPRAARDVNRALASGDSASVVTALDALIEKTHGGARPALEALRADLIQTGDVSVEQAQRIAMATAQATLEGPRRFLGLSIGGPSRLRDALAQAGAASGNYRLTQDIEAALSNNDLITAINLLNDALVVAAETDWIDDRAVRAIQDFTTEVRNISAIGLPATVTDPGTSVGAPSTRAPASFTGAGVGTGGTTAAAEAVVTATVDSVFADLAAAGLRSLNITTRLIASGVDEEEARTEDLRTRLRLVREARSELLENHYDEVSDAELEYLTTREQQLLAELEASQEIITAARERWAAAMEADRSGYTAPTPGAPSRALMQDQIDLAMDTLQAMLASGLRFTLEEANAAIEAVTRHAPTSAAQINEWRDTLTGALQTAEEAFNEFPVLMTPPGGWQPTGRAIANQLIEGARERAGEIDFGSPFATLGPVGPSGAARQLSDAAAVAWDTVEALVAAGAPAEEVNAAVEQLTSIMPMTTAEINELTGGAHRLETAIRGALPPLLEAVEAFDEFPTLDRSSITPLPLAGLTPAQRAAGDRFGETALQLGRRSERDRLSDGGLAEARREQEARQQSADTFAETVVDAGFQFTEGLIDAIKSGSVADAFSSAIQAGQSILGAADLGSVSFLGGSIGLGTLLSGGLGIIGALLSGLFGGGRDSIEAERARAGQVRSAPSIHLHIEQNNSLQVESLTDPDSRAAIRRFTDDQLARIIDVVERNILPRLDRMEAAT